MTEYSQYFLDLSPGGIEGWVPVTGGEEYFGQAAQETTALAAPGRYSPDRTRLATMPSAGALDQALLISEAATGKPLFRVMGAITFDWLANGGLLVATTEGRLAITPDGQVQRTPLTTLAPRPEELLPSPVDGDRFIMKGFVFSKKGDLRVVDAGGQTLQAPAATT